MSYWHEKGKADLSLSEDKKELHIYLENNEQGAIYVSVEIKDIQDLLGN